MLAPQTFRCLLTAEISHSYLFIDMLCSLASWTAKKNPRLFALLGNVKNFLLLQKSPSSAVDLSELDERSALPLIPNPEARSLLMTTRPIKPRRPHASKTRHRDGGSRGKMPGSLKLPSGRRGFSTRTSRSNAGIVFELDGVVNQCVLSVKHCVDGVGGVDASSSACGWTLPPCFPFGVVRLSLRLFFRQRAAFS
jgi:hypothetical protein